MEFYPDNNAGLVGSSSQLAAMPTTVLPEVGDTMYVVVHQYGGFSVVNRNDSLQNGAKIIEVEVKTLKTAKTIIE